MWSRPALSAVAAAGMISFAGPTEKMVEDVGLRLAAPTVTLVVPVLTSGSRAVVRTRQPLIRATFLPS